MPHPFPVPSINGESAHTSVEPTHPPWRIRIKSWSSSTRFLQFSLDCSLTARLPSWRPSRPVPGAGIGTCGITSRATRRLAQPRQQVRWTRFTTIIDLILMTANESLWLGKCLTMSLCSNRSGLRWIQSSWVQTAAVDHMETTNSTPRASVNFSYRLEHTESGTKVVGLSLGLKITSFSSPLMAVRVCPHIWEYTK